ncbi:MAG: hypothetical protein NTU44_06660 [Bacteroidetes bacterium]|nr:hypothetical protein [Bacteroidota bacterium]
MKRTVIFCIGILLMIFWIPMSSHAAATNSPTGEGTISISATPDLYDLAVKWAGEYGKLNPDLKIQVIKITNLANNQPIGSESKLCFISSVYQPALTKSPGWEMVVGRDAMVPVINAKNPVLTEITTQGISSNAMARLFIHPDQTNWGSLVKKGKGSSVNFYFIDNESMKDVIARFMNIDPSLIRGIKVANGEELVSVVKKDPNALGFCQLTNIMNDQDPNMAISIKLLPIDRNANGKMDYAEKIYDDLDDFIRGVWIGKYPQSLCRNIYSLSSAKPANENEVAFLSWVLTNGQKYLGAFGYSELVSSDAMAKLDLLNNNGVTESATPKQSPVQLVLLIVLAFIITTIIVISLVRYYRRRKSVTGKTVPSVQHVFNESSVVAPNGLYFDKTHTWAFMEHDGTVKLGIDDFLQHVTGPLTRVKMKKAGEKVLKGDVILSIIQNGKQLNISAPVSGIIKARNEMLENHSSVLNTSPYSEGWVYQIEPTNWMRETQFLLMAEKYREWAITEFSRSKDFLADAVNPNTMEYAHVVLQDGGVLKDSVLAEFGPEVWDDFQTRFIDTSK